MDFHTLTSNGLDGKLKCFVCNNYLSFFPLSLCSNNQNLCGRCTVPDGIICFQEEALEIMCQFLRFPCRYKSNGCSEELLPKNTPEHEQTCSYRPVSCIVGKPNDCKWIGALPDLLSHCKKDHYRSLLRNGRFKLDTSSSHEHEYLIEDDGDLLIVTNKFDHLRKIWQCAIHCHQYQLYYIERPCQVKITSDSTTMLHSFKTTRLADKTFNKINLHQFVESDAKSKKFLDIILSVGEDDERQISIFEEVFLKVSSLIKCAECSKAAIPQPYRRVSDMQIICTRCKPLTDNSMCIVDPIILDPTLDVFSKCAIFSCMYRKHGCNFVSYERPTWRHENYCSYRTTKCPFYGMQDCTWEGPENGTSSHALAQHEDLLLESGAELPFDLTSNSVKHRLIKFADCFFRFSYCLAEDRYFKFALQRITERGEGVKYEIQVGDVTNRGQRLIMSRLCWSLKKQNEVFEYGRQISQFHRDQIYDFAWNNREFTTFTVRLFR